jgi:DeoR/GlpR family transcriptional regulator of sugar metabolism
MLAEERRRKIEVEVKDRGHATLEDLEKRFHVSRMTIRRDLDSLQEQGRLQRVRGGAVSHRGGDAPHVYFETRDRMNRGQKARIARYAVEHLVDEGDILIMEGGTTVSGMASDLSIPNLTVLTNGLMVLNRAHVFLPDIQLMCCGGILRHNTLTFVGPQAQAFFREVRANKCFLSGTGLTVEDGLADIDLLETEVKRAMAASAAMRILLMDSSKLGVRSLSPVLALGEFDMLVTGAEAPPDAVAALRSAGLEVRLVP